MTRLTASDRLGRLLAIIPWVAARDGVALDEVAARFAYPVDALIADLEHVVLFVGVYPFTPDTLIEVVIDDGKVWISYADYFAEPMRLGPDQAVALLSAGKSLLELMPEEDGPLLRALAKLSAGIGPGALDVRLSDVATPTLSVLREALGEGRSVELSYYSFGRDELTHRRVDPQHLFARDGHWYLAGYCYLAEGERVFRVDRVDRIDPTDQPNVHQVEPGSTTSLPIEATDLPTITIRLGPDDRWVATTHPHALTDDPDVVELPISAEGWLARLLLRLGPRSEVVSCEEPYSERVAFEAAERIRQRYV